MVGCDRHHTMLTIKGNERTLTEMINEPAAKIVCAWCNRIMREGVLPISHGICQPCKTEYEKADT